MRSNAPSAYLQAAIRSLPATPGVYFFKDRKGCPVYIGKANAIRKRVQSHFRHWARTSRAVTKEEQMLAETSRIDFVPTPTESEALLLEASLVREHQPKYNQELKDDKSYPFLKITNERFPRLLVVRGRKPDGAKYFGPYTSVYLLRQGVRLLRRLFPMRTCNPIPDKVCLMYHIGQCRGPCVGLIGEKEYGAIVRELELFLDGRRDVLVKSLMRRMREHSGKREYEKAKLLHDQIRALSSIPQGAGPKPQVDVPALLQTELGLEKRPRRIEAFDISNTFGRKAVGSMVVFVDGKPAKSEYRRFRVRTVEGIDDYRMLQEVLRRRYGGTLARKKDWPDLVLIDGGKGHLSAALKVRQELGLEDLDMVSIAKQHEHIFLPGQPAPRIFPLNSPVLQLFQYLRDEAHRFAIAYHRHLRRREFLGVSTRKGGRA